MAIHDIKTINPFFNDVWTGLKNFEVRKKDRDYRVGDGLQEHGIIDQLQFTKLYLHA